MQSRAGPRRPALHTVHASIRRTEEEPEEKASAGRGVRLGHPPRLTRTPSFGSVAFLEDNATVLPSRAVPVAGSPPLRKKVPGVDTIEGHDANSELVLKDPSRRVRRRRLGGRNLRASVLGAGCGARAPALAGAGPCGPRTPRLLPPGCRAPGRGLGRKEAGPGRALLGAGVCAHSPCVCDSVCMIHSRAVLVLIKYSFWLCRAL